MAYDPKPLQIEGVELSPELRRLTEQLAENAHDAWARRRLNEGWRHGPERNDTRKEHPSLVPYAELSDSEKEYDRTTAMGTIRALLAMGYCIQPPSPGAASPCQPSQKSSELLESIRRASEEGFLKLRSLWAEHKKEEWKEEIKLYRLLGDKFHRIREPLLSYDVASEGLATFKDDVRLRQLKARALKVMGQTEAADGLLRQLYYKEGNRDEETIGLFASLQKDLAFAASNENERSDFIAISANLYVRAYELTRKPWTGINAATLRFVEGKREEAIALARKVCDDCRQRLAGCDLNDPDRYWLIVTLGEAALLLGNTKEAQDWYGQGAEEGRRRYGDLLSTRRNLRLLSGPLGKEVESIFALFHLPRVVAFVGHLVDRPGRPKPRFPPQLEGAVREAIRERLAKFNAGFGFSAAACGADILFLEALRERGAETNVVLPFGEEQFMKESVAVVPGAGWEDRFKETMTAATDKVIASGQKLVAGTTSFEFVGQLLIGLASLRASQMETELVPLTVWDGNPGDGGGGTADTVAYWHNLGHKVEIINLSEILRQQFPEQAVPSDRTGTIRTPAPGPAPELGSQICSLLFADAVGFSKLTEEEVPRFVEHFLGLVAGLTAEQRDPPLLRNTWGDGLYFVFSDVREAGVFALELCDRVKATKWSEKGLRELNLRIGLHAGPVYRGMDPVTAQRNYFGTHVSRAARIEPITQPGQVYASEPFAALAAARQVKEFDCLYVGKIAQAKDYGTYSTYVLQRRKKQRGES